MSDGERMAAGVPAAIPAQGFRERVETADGGFRLGVAIDAASHGSALWFGVVSLRPGTEPLSWDADEATHEAYYVSRGSLRIAWSGRAQGEATVEAGGAFSFAPGHTYTIENAGDEEVFVVFAVTPPPPGSTT